MDPGSVAQFEDLTISKTTDAFYENLFKDALDDYFLKTRKCDKDKLERKCTQSGDPSISHCEICFAPYCKKECQVKHGPSHRLTCSTDIKPAPVQPGNSNTFEKKVTREKVSSWSRSLMYFKEKGRSSNGGGWNESDGSGGSVVDKSNGSQAKGPRSSLKHKYFEKQKKSEAAVDSKKADEGDDENGLMKKSCSENKLSDVQSMKPTESDREVVEKVAELSLESADTWSEDDEDVSDVGSRRHVIDSLQPGLEGTFTVSLHELRDLSVLYGSLVVDSLKDSVRAAKRLASLTCVPGDKLSSTKVGDFVIGSCRNDEGQRGIVLTKRCGYLLRLVDRGHDCRAPDVYRIPPSAICLMELGCKVTLNTEIKWLKPSTSLRLKMVNSTGNRKWECEARLEPGDGDGSENGTLHGVVEVVDGSSAVSIEFGEEDYIPLMSGCRVVVTEADEVGWVCVRRVDNGWNSRYERLSRNLNDTVNEFHQVDMLNLQAGSIIRYKSSSDEKWHRARILLPYKPEQVTTVEMVDSGIREESDLRQATALPLWCLSEPFHGRRIPLFGGCSSYVAGFAKDKKHVIMTFEDLSRGVTLREEGEAAGTSIHRGGPPRKAFPKTPLLPLGIIDSFIVIHADEDEFMRNGTFWGNKESAMSEFPMIQDQISDLPESCDLSEYEPEIGEPCLAQFQGDWFRGVALEKLHSNEFRIFYVDFGNSSLVGPKKIRPISDELVEIPPMVNKCILAEFSCMSHEERRDCLERMMSPEPQGASVLAHKLDVNYVVLLSHECMQT